MLKHISIFFYISLLVDFPVIHPVAIPRYDLRPSEGPSHLKKVTRSAVFKRDNFTRIESSVKSIEELGMVYCSYTGFNEANFNVNNLFPSTSSFWQLVRTY